MTLLFIVPQQASIGLIGWIIAFAVPSLLEAAKRNNTMFG